MMKAVCVFCASSESVAETFKEDAFHLGKRLGLEEIELIYGGASIGLMGALARGVHEANGHVVSILPHFFMDKDIDYTQTDELIVTKDMRERKAIMEKRSDAFIVLPGGIGTLEEAVEILSMIQLKLTRKPLVFINKNDFYRELLDFFEKMIYLKFAKPDTMDLFSLVPDSQKAVEFIKSYVPPERRSK